MAVHSHPISAALGLEITGMTSNDLVTRAGADAAQAALDRHGVVVYREVNINDEGLLELSRMLGTLVVQPTGEHRYPEIQTITLDPAKTNALLASYRQGNFHWHIDGATDETPQKGTLLTARAVDPAGGDTEFSSTYAAYEALPESKRRRSAGCRSCIPSPMPSRWPTRMPPKSSAHNGTGFPPAFTRWCGRTATAASRCCWGRPPTRWSGGRRPGAARCWTACWTGRLSRSSASATSGASEIS